MSLGLDSRTRKLGSLGGVVERVGSEPVVCRGTILADGNVRFADRLERSDVQYDHAPAGEQLRSCGNRGAPGLRSVVADEDLAHAYLRPLSVRRRLPRLDSPR